MNEQWKDIPGYEGLYQVSSHGSVKRLQAIVSNGNKTMNWPGRILKPDMDSDGYNHVVLCKNNKTKRFFVHRLVADLFIPNPNNYPVINHKDENKLNNHVENLEWCTVSYNTQYSYNTGTHKPPHTKKVTCIETGLIYESVSAAARDFSGNPGALSRALNERTGYYKGLHFQYCDK